MPLQIFRGSALLIALALQISVLAAAPDLLWADDQAASEKQNLFGDWGGARAALAEYGTTVESIVTFDLMANTSGGIRRRAAELANYDLTITTDTAAAGLWSGGTFFLYLLGDVGSDLSRSVGDAQVTDNIEAYDTFKIYEAWYDHIFADGALSLLVGLHDYNSEFNSLDYASSLINSSFGVEADIAQVGPSIFPTTALAARIKVKPGDHSYLIAAIYDGVPGDPNDPRGTQIILHRDDGLFSAAEIGCQAAEGEPHFKYGIGGWLHTAEFEDFAGRERSRNQGLYLIGEQSLYHEVDAEQGLGIFFQTGFTEPDRNQFGNYIGAGVSYTGLIPDRDGDTVALAMAYARNGADYRRITDDAELAETTFEFTYRLELLSYLALQPDLQLVIHPGATEGVDDAVVVGLRAEVAL